MSLLAWMLYSVAVGVLLALSAWLLEWTIGRHRGPRRWVWALALLLGVGLPIIPLTRKGPAFSDRPTAGSVFETSPQTALEVEILSSYPAPTLFRWRELPVVEGFSRALQRGLLTATRTLDPGQRWSRTLALGWVGGSLLTLLLFLVGRMRLARSQRAWIPAQILGRDVLVAPTHGPAVVGLWSPQIVLPAQYRELPMADLRMILDHEEEHLKARDPLLLAAGVIPLVLFPWNLALWWSFLRMRTALEVDCDRRVLRRGIGPSAYGGLLVRIGASSAPPRLPMLSLAGLPSSLERRLKAMTRNHDSTSLPLSLSAGSLALALLLLACTATPPVDADAEGAVDEAAEVTPDLFDTGDTPPTPEAADVTLDPVRAEARLGGTPPAPLRGTFPAPLPEPRSETTATPSQPSFTPFTQPPEVLNREVVTRALEREYPPALRDAGIGGTVLVFFFINEAGAVQAVQVHQSSGSEALDEAAIRVARVFEFAPARNRDRAVPVWIQIPIVFTSRSQEAGAVTTQPPAPTPALTSATTPDPAAQRSAEGGAPESPSFTPFTRAPEALNRPVIARALEREYPPVLRDAGIGGRVIVWFFVDAAGRVQNVLIQESSGYPALDQAALRVAQVFEFTPAYNREQPVPVWIQIPITFSTR
jgi:TonB family protein